MRVLRGVTAVDHVVGIHNRADVAFFHRRFKGGEIDFAQGAFVNDGIGVVAIEFGIVRGEMLDRGADTLALHALDVTHGNFPGEVRIFAQVFEVASIHRRAVNVHGGTEHEMNALGARVSADFYSFASRERRIPGRRQRDPSGHGGGRSTVADANRPIGHAQARPAEFRISSDVEIILAADEIDLLIEGHLAENGFDALVDAIGRGDGRGNDRQGQRDESESQYDYGIAHPFRVLQPHCGH